MFNLSILTCHAQSENDVSDDKVINTVCNPHWTPEGGYCRILLKQYFTNLRTTRTSSPPSYPAWRMPDYTYVEGAYGGAAIPFYGTLEECKKISSGQACYPNHS